MIFCISHHHFLWINDFYFFLLIYSSICLEKETYSPQGKKRSNGNNVLLSLYFINTNSIGTFATFTPNFNRISISTRDKTILEFVKSYWWLESIFFLKRNSFSKFVIGQINDHISGVPTSITNNGAFLKWKIARTHDVSFYLFMFFFGF